MNAKEEMFGMAKLIQQGEQLRQRGELDTSEFSTDEAIKVGVQRLAAAKYLYELGYRLVKPADVTVVVEDGMVQDIYSTDDTINASVLDLDTQDPDEWDELDKALEDVRLTQKVIW